MAGSNTRFTVDLEPGFDRMLTTLAQIKGTTRADITRRAIASFLLGGAHQLR